MRATARAPRFIRCSIRGRLLVSPEPISFFGEVDPKTGTILCRDSPLHGVSISGRVLLLPHGRGSTVGSYILYALARHGAAPKAILAVEADPVIAVGCIIARIPYAYGVPQDLVKTELNDREVSVTFGDGRAIIEIM